MAEAPNPATKAQPAAERKTEPPPMPDVIERDVLEDYIFPDPPQPLGLGVNGHALRCYLRSDPKVMRVVKRVLVTNPLAERELRYWSYCQDEPGAKHHIAVLEAVYRCRRHVPGDIKSKEYDFNNIDRYFLISVPLEGGDLFSAIDLRHRLKMPFTELDAQNIAREMALAIAKVHDKGVCHRDLKPENFVFRFSAEYLAKHPEPKNLKYKLRLIDFGFAKSEAEGPLQTPLYTWGYAAPEVVQRMTLESRPALREGLLPYTSACDMWSFGVIVYILLCGYPPFNSTNHEMLATPLMDASIRAAAFEFHPLYWAHISDPAKDFIRKLIVLDPANRLTVKQALAHPWLAGDPAPDTPLSTPANLALPGNRSDIRHMMELPPAADGAEAAPAAGPAGVPLPQVPLVAFRLDADNAMSKRKRPAQSHP